MWLKVILFAIPMLGLHPCHVYDDYKKVIENLWKQYDQHTFYAVGEIGIDLYWDKTFHLEQVDAFKRQIALAKEVNLPFVIHSRDALDITISTVQEMQDGSLRGIFHCFNGDEMQAHKIIDAGFLLGIGGVVTYKNAGLDKVMAHMPLSQLST
jgi:TatD DNase family protein